MLTTTYRHDYLPPHTRRYEFLKGPRGADDKPVLEQEECQCIEEARVEAPKAAAEQCGGIEWTGIAPMGRLIDPRIIPTKFTKEQMDNMATEASVNCGRDQPNRFLRILRTVYPDLYERLKTMPKNELNRRMENQRMYTTYQIDYCSMNEYPEGVYESIKEKDDASKLTDNKLLKTEGPCKDFRAAIMAEMASGTLEEFFNADPCEKAYKPFKISFADSARFVDSGNNSHWRENIFAKKANFSEYMDTISKNGCVIIRNNLNNHSKCNKGKYCKHQITHTCVNLK